MLSTAESESETSSTEESTSEESDESDGLIQSQSRKQKVVYPAVAQITEYLPLGCSCRCDHWGQTGKVTGVSIAVTG